MCVLAVLFKIVRLPISLDFDERCQTFVHFSTKGIVVRRNVSVCASVCDCLFFIALQSSRTIRNRWKCWKIRNHLAPCARVTSAVLPSCHTTGEWEWKTVSWSCWSHQITSGRQGHKTPSVSSLFILEGSLTSEGWEGKHNPAWSVSRWRTLHGSWHRNCRTDREWPQRHGVLATHPCSFAL